MQLNDQRKYFFQSQIVNVLDLVGHMVSVELLNIASGGFESYVYNQAWCSQEIFVYRY